ncbi:PP2 domain-containing protein, partial [Klebsiella pneumoniae]|nr:PP2 domain-containing protein [Klebsiella pneumoniae]
MEKNKGGLCISISSKAMAITGIDDRRYWSHLSTEESRYFPHGLKPRCEVPLEVKIKFHETI